eukprot:6549541-Pyramimonas_sp.AAC.1
MGTRALLAAAGLPPPPFWACTARYCCPCHDVRRDKEGEYKWKVRCLARNFRRPPCRSVL